MALTDENNMVMPVAPMMGGGYGNNGIGGDWAWILLLLLIGGNGWGFGGFGGAGAMMGMGMADGFGLYPWINNSQNINGGFRDQMIQTTITGLGDKICSGFGDVQLGIAGLGRQICETGNQLGNVVQGGFAQAEIANGGRHNALTQQLYNNEIASLNRSFAEQTANAQGFNGVQAGISDLRYTEATEACATRTASAQNTRDIIDAQTRGTQAILDKLCALELDGVKSQLAQAQRENLSLQNAVNMASMRESQTAQTAQILAGQAAEIDGVYNRLKNCPVPSMPVYGNVPIFQCQPQNAGCGCGGFAA